VVGNRRNGVQRVHREQQKLAPLSAYRIAHMKEEETCLCMMPGSNSLVRKARRGGMAMASIAGRGVAGASCGNGGGGAGVA